MKVDVIQVKEMRKEKRDEIISFRVSSNIKDELKREAEENLISLAELMSRYMYLILEDKKA